MAELVGVDFGYGSVTYTAQVDPTPRKTTRDGNLTVINEGSPGRPGYFETSFLLNCRTQDGEIEHTNFCNWTVVSAESGKDVGYHAIEAAAARQIAPMLRAMADFVEALVAETDAKNAAGGA